MAFDFERYLQEYEPDNVEFYSRQSSVTPPYMSNDETPTVTNALTISSEATPQQPWRKLENEAQLSPVFGRIPKVKSDFGGIGKGLEVIESRFRSKENLGGKSVRGKTGLFKQTSLPASLNAYSRSKDQNESGRRRRNSVRFADEVGENLTTFLIIPSRFDDSESDKESVDANPKTTTRLNSGSTFAGKNDTSNIRPPNSNELPSAGAEAVQAKNSNKTPTFQLCFDQPAANYADFRRRLFLQFICLENVKVDVSSHADGTKNGFLNHGTVLCTIKVRNIHPIKRVFARCTDNNWKTYADVFAVYVGDGTSGFNEYDTFAFALQNPFRLKDTASNDQEANSCCRKTAAVEFALCYEVLGTEHWDNNDGQNYRIVWLPDCQTIV